MASQTKLREVQDEELAKVKSRSLKLEQEVKELKQQASPTCCIYASLLVLHPDSLMIHDQMQASDQKLKEKAIKDVASKLDKCKKMVEAATAQLASLVDDA